MNESTEVRVNTVPWQVDWMRPITERVQPDNNKCNYGSKTSHSSALVTQDELLGFVNIEDDMAADNESKLSNERLSFLVSVTLFQSQIDTDTVTEHVGNQPNPNENNRVDLADTVLLEIIEHRQHPTPNTGDRDRKLSGLGLLPTTSFGNGLVNDLNISCRCLQSRLLRWPESSVNFPTVDANALTAFWKGVFPIDTGPSPITRSSVGLIAAAWVRLPPSEMKNIDDPADALDTLQLLSLFGHEPENQNQIPKYDHIESNASESNGEKSNTLELRLVCLTNDGNLHFYSPWKLFQTKQGSTTDHSTNNDLTNSLASLFLGQHLLDTIDDNLLPLSQSLNSLKLKIPFMKTIGFKKNERDMRTTKSIQHHRSKKASESYSFWDSSVWDPMVDSETLQNQTKDNVLTHCVAAFEYVAVGGYGTRRWKASTSSSRYATNDNIEESKITRKEGQINVDVNEDKLTATNNTNDSSTIQDLNKGGGFVSFISLYHFTETRVVFLPFVPDHISPFRWSGAYFVLVTGRIGLEFRAAAIRLDSSVHFAQMFDSSAHLSNEVKIKPSNFNSGMLAFIRRFQVVPIETGDAKNVINMLGCDSMTSRPAIVFLSKDNEPRQLTVHHRLLSEIQYYAQDDIPTSFWDYIGKGSRNHLPVIQVRDCPGHSTVLPTFASQLPSGSPMKVYCHAGRGWCLIGLEIALVFVCFEGSSAKRNAFVTLLSDDVLGNHVVSSFSQVAPLDPFGILPGIKMPLQRELFGEILSESLPSMFPDEHNTQNSSDTLVETISEELLLAVESISNINLREPVTIRSPLRPSRKRSVDLTHQERYERLLCHCRPWTYLTNQSMSTDAFDMQIPYVSVQFSANNQSQMLLSLRKAMVNNEDAAPCSQILSWLTLREEYFMASSIALNMLQETESLVNLWTRCKKIYDDVTILDGLMDGIAPIQNDRGTRTRVADMAIACLLRGGFTMASTLELFLRRNLDYDPVQASLMLAAIATCTLSDEDDLVMGAMGSGYEIDDAHNDNIMWPVRCLLRVGVHRECLMSSLLLLNSSVPDELRRHRRGGYVGTSVASLDKCKRLVSLIVESSPDAAGLLLDLMDENHRSRFWTSLHHDTQLELSLIPISDKVPLLREPEVRSWATMQLQGCIESEKSITSSSSFDMLPSYWLTEMALACLKNAGCNIAKILDIDDCDEDKLSEDTLYIFEAKEKSLQASLAAASSSGGLDYDLLIPSLLMLQYRNVQWHPDAKVSTRSILNASCHIAGRPELEEPLFVMTSSTMLRHCTVLGDVRAGAKLIGGKNGFILECCYVLIEVLGMTIEDAEDFLLREPMSADKLGFQILDKQQFVLQPWHCRILLLLDEHVLRIRTYGEFETRNIRGRIDPVLAASICLRTWWAITRQHLETSTQWLIQWLKKKLSMDDELDDSKKKLSPHRLACAALIRALIWPGSKYDTNPILMAQRLEMDATFLIQLSQPCCGLMESLPNYIAEEMYSTSIRIPAKMLAK